MHREGGAALRVVGEVAVPLGERHGPQPVSSLWELFFVHSSFSAYKPHTRANFSRTAALCRLAGLAEFPTPGDVSIWVSRLRELPGRRGKKLSGTYVTLQRDNLHALFEWARVMGRGWTTELGNPVDARLCPFRRGAPMRVALRNVDDVWPFLRATAGEGNAPDVVRRRGFLGVLRFLGLRRGEALALTASSVIVDASGQWWVEVLAQREADSFVTTTTKTPRAVRKLPCRPELVQLLRAVLKLGTTTRVRVGFGGQGGEREVPFLFPFRVHDIDAMMSALRGVSPDDFPPGDAWHVFRHTVAVELSTRGVELERVSEWLGHCDIAHTQTYLRTLVGTRVTASVLDCFNDEVQPKGGSPPTRSKRAAQRTPMRQAAPPHPRSFAVQSVKTTRRTPRKQP